MNDHPESELLSKRPRHVTGACTRAAPTHRSVEAANLSDTRIDRHPPHASHMAAHYAVEDAGASSSFDVDTGNVLSVEASALAADAGCTGAVGEPGGGQVGTVDDEDNDNDNDDDRDGDDDSVSSSLR